MPQPTIESLEWDDDKGHWRAIGTSAAGKTRIVLVPSSRDGKPHYDPTMESEVRKLVLDALNDDAAPFQAPI